MPDAAPSARPPAARRASVPDDVRDPALRDALRAVDLSRALDARCRSFGGKISIRKFETPRDLLPRSTRSVIVNCTGLGAKALFGDPDLVPLKGQLVVLVPQAEVTYSTNGGVRAPVDAGCRFIHMMPRSDGIILGGTSHATSGRSNRTRTSASASSTATSISSTRCARRRTDVKNSSS